MNDILEPPVESSAPVATLPRTAESETEIDVDEILARCRAEELKKELPKRKSKVASTVIRVFVYGFLIAAIVIVVLGMTAATVGC